MTQETEDVVGRLRLFGSARPQLGLPVCDEAADLLEGLSDRIDVLTQALQEIRGFAAARTADSSGFGLIMRCADRAALHQEGIATDVGR